MRSKARKRSASSNRRSRLNVGTWITRHLQVALSSLGRLVRSPFSSLMTAAVIGISLALPGGLHLLLDNIQALGGSWNGSATISLYLQQQVSETQIAALTERIGQRQDISSVSVINRDQALQEFRQLSGFSEVLETLDGNPLPVVLVIRPSDDPGTPAIAQALADDLGSLPEVDFAQLDLQWLQRFHAITDIAVRMVWVLAGLLSLGVLLIVVNTIRLEIQNRQAEIEITKLVGGTDAFIRRPFVYSGLWFGLAGGSIAWLLITLALQLLEAPVARLTGLYSSGFKLAGMSVVSSLVLFGTGALLGVAGSWIAVGRHLHSGEPD